MEFITGDWLVALFQVIAIDLVLAGDNAIVIGLAAAGLPKDQRNKAILVGIIAATIMRIGFALITTQLLAITGLLLAGGLLLLWAVAADPKLGAYAIAGFALAPVRDLAVKEPEVEATIRRIYEGNLLGSGRVGER